MLKQKCCGKNFDQFFFSVELIDFGTWLEAKEKVKIKYVVEHSEQLRCVLVNGDNGRKQEITGPTPWETLYGSASIGLTLRKASNVQWENIFDSIKSTFSKIYCFLIFILPVIMFRTNLLGFLGPLKFY